MSKPPPVPPGKAPVDASRLDVDVVVEDDRWSSVGDVATAIQAAATALAANASAKITKPSAATILLADDAHVAQLNGSFRGKPAPTNVLSFPAGESTAWSGEPAYLGDVILALDTIERESRDLEIPALHHVQHLTVHGLLHLVGFDHETEAEARAMEAIETTVLAALGIPDPYAPDSFELVRK